MNLFKLKAFLACLLWGCLRLWSQDTSSYVLGIIDESKGGLFYNKHILDSNYTGKIEYTLEKQPIWYFKYDVDSAYDNPRVHEDLRIEITYKNGIKTEARSYYQNDRMRELSQFDSIGLNGLHTEWFENGCMHSTAYYSSWDTNPHQITWYSDGQIATIFSYNELYVVKSWHHNGVLYSETVALRPKSAGFKQKVYDEQGRIVEEGVYNNGIDKIKAYHENGKVRFEGSIYNVPEYRVGTWKEWDDEGYLVRETYYHDTIPNHAMGTWKEYNKGKMVKEYVYENGELKETKEYSPVNMGKKE